MIEIPYMVKILASVILAFLLLGIAIIFINKTRKRRQQDATVRERQSRKPFPQSATLSENALTAKQGDPQSREQIIRNHYCDWLARYLLPTYDARGAFVRVGVERKRLRYQVSTTSLAQGFALLQSVLIGGDDLAASDRYERLLTFVIAYPSNQSEDLCSWHTLPDMTAPPKLESDPHAEAWIAYSLLMAEKQWGQSENFDYKRMLEYRLSALLELQQSIEASDHKRAIYAPLFFDAFARQSDAEAWEKIALDLRKELLAHIKGTELIADGSAEEAWLAFSTLHVGLAGLLLKESSHQSLANQFESLVYNAIKTLPAKLEQAEEDGLSPLALLACCAPLAMLQNDQDLLEKYWNTLSTHKSNQHDAIGETLRLLALITLNGNFWV